MSQYFNSILYNEVSLEPSQLNKNINEHILSNLKLKVEGKCINEGYVREGSIKMISKSNGFFCGSLFTGSVKYYVTYSADICNPNKGEIIDCKVKYLNKLGIQAEAGPLTIIIAKEFHENKKIFKDIKQGQSIKVVVIDKLFNLNDRNISIAAKLNIDSEKLIEKDNIDLAKNKKDIKTEMIPLSSLDNFNDIDIDSLAEEIELDDTKTINLETGTNMAEANEANFNVEQNINSFETITNKNNIGPETNTNIILNNSNEKESDEEESDEEESDEEESDEENSEDEIDSDENSNIDENEESGDELEDDESRDSNEEEYQDSSDDEQIGGDSDIKTIKIPKSMLIPKNI